MSKAGKWARLGMTAALSGLILASAPAPASDYSGLDKLPDWTRTVWYPDFGAAARSRPSGPPKPPPYTAAAAKALADFNAAKSEGENLQSEDANCVPPGMPRMMQMPYPVEFLFNPGRVTILTEAYMQVRRIYTDGRPLPDDPDPQFNGNSIGHWEGDTLVVETVGLEPQTTIMTAIHPTEKTKIVERIREAQPGVLTDEMTITDPSIFTEPYHTTLAFSERPDWTIREYVCNENNRDAADPFGRPSMDLSFPDEKK